MPSIRDRASCRSSELLTTRVAAFASHGITFAFSLIYFARRLMGDATPVAYARANSSPYTIIARRFSNAGRRRRDFITRNFILQALVLCYRRFRTFDCRRALRRAPLLNDAASALFRRYYASSQSNIVKERIKAALTVWPSCERMLHWDFQEIFVLLH